MFSKYNYINENILVYFLIITWFEKKFKYYLW